MTSQRKNNILKIDKEELEILSLISIGAFGEKNYLFSKKDCKNPIKIGNMEYVLTFAPNHFHEKLKNCKTILLECENKIVGSIEVDEIYENDKSYTSIFNPFECTLSKDSYCIGGSIDIKSSNIYNELDFIRAHQKKLGAKKITALILDLDPLHRAHELMIRWSIDKADMVMVFITNKPNQLDFDLRIGAFKRFIKKYLPQDKVVYVELKDIKFYGLNVNPALECLLVKAFNANKLVITQNHMGVGVFYDHNRPKTMLDDFAKEYDMELIVLPEIVFCAKCQNIVSIKSCPHGNHHHIRYRSDIIKELLYQGIVPPTVLLRSETSSYLLSKLHKNRFKNIQIFYDGLFTNNGLIEKKSDEDFYKELIKLYHSSYLS